MKRFRFILPLLCALGLWVNSVPAMAQAKQLIKQSTGITLTFTMWDSVTHQTGVTGITPAVYISKAGAAGAASTNAAAAVDATNFPGLYKIALTSAETGTTGTLDLAATGAGADVQRWAVQVVAFDPNAAADLGLSSLSSVKTTADKLNALVQVTGTVNDAGATTTGFITSLSSTTTDLYKGNFCLFTTGANAGSFGVVSAYNGTTKAVTFLTAVSSAPANGDAFVLANGLSRKQVDVLATYGTDNKPILSNNAHTGVVIPTVTTVTNPVTAGTVSDKTGYALSAGEHTNIGTDAQGAMNAQGYTVARAAYIDVLNTLGATVWGYTTRTLTGVTFPATVPSLAQITAGILVNPGQPILTDASGRITLTPAEHTAVTNELMGATIFGNVTLKQGFATTFGILANDGTRTWNAATHTATQVYYACVAGSTAADHTKPLVTHISVYDATNTQLVSRTSVFSNLP